MNSDEDQQRRRRRDSDPDYPSLYLNYSMMDDTSPPVYRRSRHLDGGLMAWDTLANGGRTSAPDVSFQFEPRATKKMPPPPETEEFEEASLLDGRQNKIPDLSIEYFNNHHNHHNNNLNHHGTILEDDDDDDEKENEHQFDHQEKEKDGKGIEKSMASSTDGAGLRLHEQPPPMTLNHRYVNTSPVPSLSSEEAYNLQSLPRFSTIATVSSDTVFATMIACLENEMLHCVVHVEKDWQLEIETESQGEYLCFTCFIYRQQDGTGAHTIQFGPVCGDEVGFQNFIRILRQKCHAILEPKSTTTTIMTDTFEQCASSCDMMMMHTYSPQPLYPGSLDYTSEDLAELMTSISVDLVNQNEYLKQLVLACTIRSNRKLLQLSSQFENLVIQLLSPKTEHDEQSKMFALAIMLHLTSEKIPMAPDIIACVHRVVAAVHPESPTVCSKMAQHLLQMLDP